MPLMPSRNRRFAWLPGRAHIMVRTVALAAMLLLNSPSSALRKSDGPRVCSSFRVRAGHRAATAVLQVLRLG